MDGEPGPGFETATLRIDARIKIPIADINGAILYILFLGRWLAQAYLGVKKYEIDILFPGLVVITAPIGEL